MDLTDLAIIKLLLRNSRATYREIAEKLELTVNAIYKRIQKMNDLGVILCYTATPSLAQLDGHRILISGESAAKNLTELAQELGKHESIFFVGMTGGKYLLIDGEIKNITALLEYSAYVQETAQLSELFLGIVHQPQVQQKDSFNKTDEKVLKALAFDARKSSVEIAEETGLSAKTVRNTLERFQKKEMVHFSIHWAPSSKTDHIGNIEIYLNPEQNLNDERFRLLQKYPQIVYFQTFSNIPKLIMITTWFDSSSKMQPFCEELQSYGYKDVILRVIYNGHFFPTWRTTYFQSK